MIQFNSETGFTLEKQDTINKWISNVILFESFKEGDINYVFCDDEYLHKLNMEFLSHDTLTDIISFDYSVGKIINGDVFISIERVEENAKIFNNRFLNELYRVLVHGVLHYCGYKDKTEADKKTMRSKEDFYLLQLPLVS